MKNTFLVAAILALLITLATAQRQNTAPADSSNPSQAAVRGCVTGATGQYRLVDDNHIVYRLIGQDKELSGYDGQQVEVTGKVDERIPRKEKQTASSFSRPERLLTVAGVSKISDTCTGSSE
ncbi:MAG TPA: hypothetical protein VJN48_07345 [Terriglobales bacterium]|nr:hypothetical protein [Terriglobales bacterium]